MDAPVVVITGANAGIGQETAVGTATLGATTVLASRDVQRGEAAAAEVRRRSGQDDVHSVHLDLADLESVQRCAGELTRRFDRLDVLVNNAGGVWSSRQLTLQGFEQTFGVNHLGHFHLTRLLLERLRASAPSRVVTVSSVGHHAAVGGLHWDDLQSERRYGALAAYSRSKLANLLFARHLAAILAGTGVTSNALHPGPVRSDFGMDGDLDGLARLGLRLVRPFEISAAAGSRTSIFLAMSPEVAGHTGGYYVRCRPGRMSVRARSDTEAAHLWEVSERMVTGAGFPGP